VLRHRYAETRGRGERWARLHAALPRASAKLAWELFWDAHHRWWTRDERGGDMAATGDPVELPVPRTPYRVVVRPGTSDAMVYYDCIIDRQYTRALGARTIDIRTILDAGANVGMASVAFLTACPNARLLAVECDPENAGVARRNLSQFHSRADLIEAALWHTPERIALADGERGTWASHVEPSESGDLATITPWGCMARLGGTVDIVKIDIEGAEIPLFSGVEASKWLTGVRRFLLIEPENELSANIVDEAMRRGSAFARSYAYRDVVGYARLSP
jgi:FkbM family methyltransferase